MVEGNYRQVNVGPKVTFLNGLTRVGPSLAVGQFESKSEAFIRFKPALTLPEYKEFSLKHWNESHSVHTPCRHLGAARQPTGTAEVRYSNRLATKTVFTGRSQQGFCVVSDSS